MFEGKYVRFRDFPVIGESVIIDSKMNAEIRPNDNFDNPAKEQQVDNDGNPILPPIIEDSTPPSIIPSIDSSQRNLDNRMPQDNDLDFE
jgi:hypothetical protein